MCLILKNPDVRMPEIAKRKISVWKVIEKDNTSAYKDFQYSPNKTYKTTMAYPYSELGIGKVYEGFHAFTNRSEARTELRYWCTVVGRQSTHKIVKFTIPKGAQYHLGDQHDIVSNQIRSGDLKHCR